MNDDETTRIDAALDAQLRELPLEVAPGRDLWPGIAATIGETVVAQPATAPRRAWAWQAAAAVVLVAGSSLLTAALLDRREPPQQAAATSPVTTDAMAHPVAFGPAGRLDPEYLKARRQLTQMLDQRIAAMPPAARAKLESNLGELRRAADEINAALAEQPGDPLLEELLLKTYQDELAVLASVSQLTNSLAGANDAGAAKRIQL